MLVHVMATIFYILGNLPYVGPLPTASEKRDNTSNPCLYQAGSAGDLKSSQLSQRH